MSDDSVARAAADWIVRLSAEDPAEREKAYAGFEAWKRTDPQHAAVAAGMERFVDQARSLGGAAPRAALEAVLDAPRPRGNPTSRVRRAARLLALAFILILPAAFALRAVLPSELLADLRTATGEQRQHLLADGTRLTLGTATAVDYAFSPDLRRVTLLSGEILVEVASDASRPFVVKTRHGRIRALGTRFIVRHDAGSTLLTMLESATMVGVDKAGEPEVRVNAGERVRVSVQGVETLAGVDPVVLEDAFQRRRLVVKDRPLPEVLDELARHRRGIIRYDRAEIQDIRVSAVLPLDDTDRALRLLRDNFAQLRVRTVTPWVVWVDLPR